MGQDNCRCSLSSQNDNFIPKCSLLNQHLLTQFSISDKSNEYFHQQMSSSYVKQTATISPKYTDLLIILKNSNNKFIDTYFPPPKPHTSNHLPWLRLSTKRQQQKVVNNTKLSKFCKTLKSILKNYNEIIQQIKPIYIQKKGLAICYLWIQGNKTQILIDDYLPIEKFTYDVQDHVLLMEKAFAKVLGEYKYIQLFSIGEIFTEITGIPHYSHEQLPNQFNQQNNYNSINSIKCFKDALKCDEILYQTTTFSSNPSLLGCRNKYHISSISFENFEHKPTIIKMIIPNKQILSVRIIRPLTKYKDIKQSQMKQYNPLHLQCFEQKNGRLQLFGKNYPYQNCIYLNNIFTELSGTYYIYIRQFIKSTRLSMIAYSASTVKFTQMFNEFYAKNFINNQIKTLQSNIKQQDIGNNVSAKIIQTSNKICLYFNENYKQKMLKVLNRRCFILIEDKGKGFSELTLNNVSGKWIFILFMEGVTNSNEKIYKIFDI